MNEQLPAPRDPVYVVSVNSTTNGVDASIDFRNGFELQQVASISFYHNLDGIPTSSWVQAQRRVTQPHEQGYLDDIEAKRPGLEREKEIQNALAKDFAIGLGRLLSNPDDSLPIDFSVPYSFRLDERVYGLVFNILKTKPDGETIEWLTLIINRPVENKLIKKIKESLPALLTELAGVEKALRAPSSLSGPHASPGA